MGFDVGLLVFFFASKLGVNPRQIKGAGALSQLTPELLHILKQTKTACHGVGSTSLSSPSFSGSCGPGTLQTKTPKGLDGGRSFLNLLLLWL